ncbi:MAG: hypothetical protein GX638_02570 [Crenarchaeota archaeon]|nr:hypothetical protein [Thermoproteota archaeon]
MLVELSVFTVMLVLVVAGVVIWEEVIKPRKDQKRYKREFRGGKSREYLQNQIDQLVSEKSNLLDNLSNMRIALLECCQLLGVTKSDWAHEDTLLNFPNVLREHIQKNNQFQEKNKQLRKVISTFCDSIIVDFDTIPTDILIDSARKVIGENKILNEEIKQLREVINDFCDYSIVGIDKISTVDLIEIAKRVNTEKKELSILASGFANHNLFDTHKTEVERENIKVEAENLQRKELEKDPLYSVVDGFAHLLTHLNSQHCRAYSFHDKVTLENIYSAVEQAMEDLNEKLYKKQLRRKSEE